MTTKKQFILIIALLALLAFITMPVQAMTITMSNPDATIERDIIAYWPNGTIYGSYNTTSIIDLDAGSDYIFVLKPQYSSPLDEPVVWVNSMFSFIGTNILPILITIFLIGLLLSRRR